MTPDLFSALKDYCEFHLSHKRYLHSLAVGEMFYILDGGNTDKDTAVILGLFHDIAHNWDENKMLFEIDSAHLELMAGERDDKMLLHAVIGAAALKDKLPALDEKYYRALRYHTCPIMGLGGSELNFYTADKIDKTRSHISDEFRKSIIDEKNPEIRCLMLLKCQKNYLIEQGKDFIPSTLKLYKYLEEKYVGL